MTSKKRTWTISLRNKSNFFMATLMDEDVIEGERRWWPACRLGMWKI
jgi:hypothetical protein